jgi:hypothetical protein
MPEDFIINLYNFMEDFDLRYGKATTDDILKLCRQIRN